MLRRPGTIATIRTMGSVRHKSVSVSPRGMIFPSSAVVLNVCRESEVHIVERLGKFHSIRKPGWHLTIPVVDKVWKVRTAEMCLDIDPLRATTQDNVMVETCGSAYVQIVDPKEALYGHVNPFAAVSTHAQSAMRVAIGGLTLDQCFHNRTAINSSVTESVQAAVGRWGMRVLRYELTSLTPDTIILQSMDKQAAAERTRREKVTLAEADKRSEELKAEAQLIKVQREVDGQAYRVNQEALAKAQSMATVADALRAHGEEGRIAVQLLLAKDYLTMMTALGGASNTIMFGGSGPGDMRHMGAELATVLKALPPITSSSMK